jgi:hypothetical protein
MPSAAWAPAAGLKTKTHKKRIERSRKTPIGDTSDDMESFEEIVGVYKVNGHVNFHVQKGSKVMHVSKDVVRKQYPELFLRFIEDIISRD